MSQIQIFNPSSTDSTSWHWVTLSGPDAQDFLHRLSTCNTRELSINSGKPACFLTAQGKMRAYFNLWNCQSNEFALEFDGGVEDSWKNSLLATIDQYTFSEKMTLIDHTAQESPQLTCRWLLIDSMNEEKILRRIQAPSSAAGATWLNHEKIRFCNHGMQNYGKLWISVWGPSSLLPSWIQEHFPDALETSSSVLEKSRIEAAQPRVGFEIDENTIPLEVGLIHAIAQAKGCYPGQEVIERILSLGAPARRLVQLELETIAPPTTPNIQKNDRIFTLPNQEGAPTEIGFITSLAYPKALGFIRKSHAKIGVEVRISGLNARITQVTPDALE